MPILIKNCGLKTPEAITEAVRTGASFVGFVHSAGSPRHLALAEIAALAAHVPAAVKRVIVTTTPDDALLAAIAAMADIDFLQVHGVTDAARLQHIAQQVQKPLITAIQTRTPADIDMAHALEPFSAHVLFDAPSAGSGHSFDWNILRDALTAKPLSKPWFLAGGLNVGNVVDAIRITAAPMVDVSSGIESTRGTKSLEMIAAFNKAVLEASA